jgi:hypothetical protein
MKNLFISLMIFMSAFAHAETEVNFIPKSGESAVRLDYNMGPNYNYTSTGASKYDQNVTNSILNLDYMFGVDNEMSVGAAINTGTKKSETTINSIKSSTNYTGMSDLFLKLKMTTGMWVYGLDMGLPFQNQITEGDSGNRNSGGIALIPNGGFLMQNGTWNFGGLFSYNYLLDRKNETKTGATSSIDTISGGSYLTITPFAEWNYGSGLVFAELALNSISDSTNTSPTDVKTTIKAVNHNILKFGGTYHFTTNITGLASYALDMFDSSSAGGTPAFTASTFALGARFVF